MEVQTLTAGEVLRASGVRHVDFFSLDVEGHELQSLQGMDWSVRVSVWCIEMLDLHTHEDKGLPATADTQALRQLLSDHGYHYHSRIHFNEVWICPHWWRDVQRHRMWRAVRRRRMWRTIVLSLVLFGVVGIVCKALVPSKRLSNEHI
jgi:hypothetical protein